MPHDPRAVNLGREYDEAQEKAEHGPAIASAIGVMGVLDAVTTSGYAKQPRPGLTINHLYEMKHQMETSLADVNRAIELVKQNPSLLGQREFDAIVTRLGLR